MRSNALLVLAILVIVWGAAGTIDVGNMPYSGYTTGPSNTVTQVQAGSPAEAAGMQRGDVVRSVGGISVEDMSALTQRGRAAVGETRTHVVARNGQELALDVTFAGLPRGQAIVAYLSSLIGLLFVTLGMWARRKAPNRATELLAWLGVTFGLAFMAAPYFQSATLRIWSGALVTVGVVMGFAILVDFLTRTGHQDGFGDADVTSPLVYAPAGLVALLLAAISVIQPAATGGLNRAVSVVVGLFLVGYFGTAIVKVVRNYTRADQATRESRALGMMLAGVLVGLVPVTVGALVTLVSPQTVIPTSQYWFLTFAAVPVTFALAAVKGSEGASAAAGAPAAAAAPAPTAMAEPAVAPEPAVAAEPAAAPAPPAAPASAPAAMDAEPAREVAPEPAVDLEPVETAREAMTDASSEPSETPPARPITRSVGGPDSGPSTMEAPEDEAPKDPHPE